MLLGHQRRGVRGALLEVAKAGSASLLLWTFEKAGARRFYEARGFVAIERTGRSGNEEREPDALYRWDQSRMAAMAASAVATGR